MPARRVLVIGLAATGDAVVRYLHARGDQVVVLEDAPTDADAYLERRGRVLALGVDLREGAPAAALRELVEGVELVVPSPGVPERHPALRAARDAGVPVRSEIDLASEHAAQVGHPRVLAVTGTNGKTTVTTLVAAMLSASGVPARAAGNIGTPLLDAVQGDADVVVAEVSSFQLVFTTVFRPEVAAFLNVADDHLDWHGSFDAYANAKARIFEHQQPPDLLVYNRDDRVVARLAASAPGRRLAFSVDPASRDGLRVDDRDGAAVLVTENNMALAAVAALPRHAPHDLANALAAAGVALAAGGDQRAVTDVLTGFDGLPHHIELIAEHDGVAFYDDSKATNVHAVAAALRGLPALGPGRAVLVAGGRNKGLDLRALRPEASRLRAVVAIGEAAAEVDAAFADLVPVVTASSMRQAVEAAADVACPGDVVLLSPACASFDWYGSYRERGEDFVREVRRLESGQR